MKNIGFRIDDEQYAELEQKANLAGVSIHEIARSLTLKGTGENSELIRMELGKLSGEVSELRSDLGKVTELLLFALGNVPLDQAKDLVTELLRRAA